MAKKSSGLIVTPTKVPSYYAIGIFFPDGKKIVKQRCSINELLETYFLNLDKLINKANSPEELFEKYQKKYEDSGIKVTIQYIDSWGHLWKGKIAWPREVHFINYLKERMKK
mgnify:CR=1 FL=1